MQVKLIAKCATQELLTYVKFYYVNNDDECNALKKDFSIYAPPTNVSDYVADTSIVIVFLFSINMMSCGSSFYKV